jgi:hypothetical protein
MPRWVTILILAGMLLVLALLAVPYVGRLRENANRTRCENNLRLFGAALSDFAEHHQALPPGTVVLPGVPPEDRLSWHAYLLDHYPRADLSRAVARDQPWTAEPNQTAGRSFLLLMVCPTLTLRPTPADQPALTNYVGLAGIGPDAATRPPNPRAGLFRYDEPTPWAATEGRRANTVMLGETGRDVGPWLRGGPSTVRGLDPARPPYLGPEGQFGGGHPSVGNFLNADGSLRVLRDDIAPDVLEKLVGIADGAAPP